jgi:TetR/AcrR family transcriptional regulator, regulator of biofilm formation and stress response
MGAGTARLQNVGSVTCMQEADVTALAEAREDRQRIPYGEGREALLKAVISVVARSGLRNLTYRAVAAEAGVAHGLVRHHFGSRDTLIKEALHYSVTQSIDTTALESGSGNLGDLARNLAMAVNDDPDIQVFQFELILEARRRPELRQDVEVIYETYRDAVYRALSAAGIDDRDLAELVFCTLDGLVFQQVALGSPEATSKGLRQLRKLLETVQR